MEMAYISLTWAGQALGFLWFCPASFPTSSSRRSLIIEEGGNITMLNSYAALDDESEEVIENVYDELAKLSNSIKIGGTSSTFTVAAS
ncbi:hypothetical protein Tco_0698064 [Tanacetum coccineum]